MATIDYGKKLIRYGASFMPSGDLEADFEIIRRFYAGAQGRHPERQGEIRVRPVEANESNTTPGAANAKDTSA